jgi:hypothetical protein
VVLRKHTNPKYIILLSKPRRLKIDPPAGPTEKTFEQQTKHQFCDFRFPHRIKVATGIKSERPGGKEREGGEGESSINDIWREKPYIGHMFISPRLSQQPRTISLEDIAFVAI